MLARERLEARLVPRDEAPPTLEAAPTLDAREPGVGCLPSPPPLASPEAALPAGDRDRPRNSLTWRRLPTEPG